MTDKPLDVSDIADQLRAGQLPRRALVDRLRALGIGFGAAFVLGVGGAQAAVAPDTVVALKSTNPAIDAIIKDGPQLPAGVTESGPMQQMAYYRFFRRWFRRWYRRFRW